MRTTFSDAFSLYGIDAAKDLELSGLVLQRGLRELWGRSQQRMASLLSAGKLTTATISVDEFLTVLNTVFKLIAIGDRASKLAVISETQLQLSPSSSSPTNARRISKRASLTAVPPPVPVRQGNFRRTSQIATFDPESTLLSNEEVCIIFSFEFVLLVLVEYVKHLKTD